MRWPDPSIVWKAIDAYMSAAYPGPAPSGVRARLDTLKALDAASFYESAVFESRGEPGHERLLLRLGNKVYPHMKLVIERRPDRHGFLFRADTHDAHCCPAPASREYASFRALMEANQTIGQAIDAAWEAAGLPTFKTYLKEDLARRQAAARGN
ncbi:MAG: hypothetical protein ACAI43_24065 [Phycisphaerae bacterium]|nr:hypothetical protein [Tepidisphaeraceae bacterium]